MPRASSFLRGRPWLSRDRTDPGSAAGDELKSGVYEPQPPAMLKPCMKVSDLAQLRDNPTLIHQPFVTLQLLRSIILRQQCLENRFSCQHTAFYRGVNSLQPLRVEKACTIPDQQNPIRVNLRHGKIAASGNRLGSVADHLSPIK